MFGVFVLWMIIGFSILAWIIFALRYIPQSGQVASCPKNKFLLMFLPLIFLIGGGFYLTDRQEDKISKGCGTIIEYKMYMSAGNKNNKKPFQRVEIQFLDQQYSRHLKIEDNLVIKKVGEYMCFEFYDRKLNPHLTDSSVVR